MKRTLSVILSVVFILILCSSCSSVPTSPVSSLDFSSAKSSVEVEAGKSATGYFKVTASGEYSTDELKLISSDPSIATFELDGKQVNDLIYYKINGLRSGDTTIYVQTSDGTVKSSELPVSVSGYIYDIAEFDDTSIPTAKRMTLRVTAAEDYIGSMDDAAITDMLKYIADNYASSHKVNAVVVHLFYEGDDTSGAYSVATCTYAPEGEIAKAVDVKAGDYSTFDYSTSIRPESERQMFRQ